MAEHSYERPAETTGRELQPASANPPPAGISESDYEAIEDAVMETARGRWFLKEFARRMRASETASLHSALERIERIVSLTHAPRADAEAQLKMRESMEGICERLLDISWYMRERGFSGSLCASIDEEARQLAGLMKALDITAAAEDDAHADGEGEAGAPWADAAGDDAPAADTPESGETQPLAPAAAVAAEASGVGEEHPAHDAGPAVCESEQASDSASRLAAFVHISAMPVRERLALCA